MRKTVSRRPLDADQRVGAGGAFQQVMAAAAFAVAYLAWGLTPGESEPEATEELVVKRVPLAEAFRMIEAGEIRVDWDADYLA